MSISLIDSAPLASRRSLSSKVAVEGENVIYNYIEFNLLRTSGGSDSPFGPVTNTILLLPTALVFATLFFERRMVRAFCCPVKHRLEMLVKASDGESRFGGGQVAAGAFPPSE